VLGLLAARRLGVATAEPGVDGALAKITRVLPAALRERVRAVQETLGFTRAAPDAAPPATATVLALADAARRARRVRVRYRSRGGEERERELDPYGLVVHGGRWYLAAHDHGAREIRTFRVDRVLEADILGQADPPPEGFDAVDHVSRALARVPWTHEVEVLLHTTAGEARARIPATVGELEDAPGGVLLRARAERLDGMARMLAGLGWPFTVRRPDELRAAVRELAGSLEACAARR
jgi:predicted DNA-binding transcriptional regulator YafY